MQTMTLETPTIARPAAGDSREHRPLVRYAALVGRFNALLAGAVGLAAVLHPAYGAAPQRAEEPR